MTSKSVSNKMDVKKLIGKSLQPARPKRAASQNGPMLMFDFRAHFTDCFPEDIDYQFDLWCSVNKLNKILKDPEDYSGLQFTKQLQPENKKGRITYTRDFLIQLSNLSVCRQKPVYLPNHPIVLEKPHSNGSFENESPAPINFENESPAPINFENESPAPINLKNESPAPINIKNESPAPISFESESPAPINVSSWKF